LHYNALNEALRSISRDYVINREEHLSIYDGLSTTRKLHLLTEKKGLPPKYYNHIWKVKQEKTLDLLSVLEYNPYIINYFKEIADKDIKIAVASNSIRETLRLSLFYANLTKFVDYYVSNEDVSRPKPYPEMYWKCMTAMNAIPKNTVIFEDSHIGREAAINSGAHLVPIKDCRDMTANKIHRAFDILDGLTRKQIPWKDDRMNVLIPMAGAGSRFAQAGFTFPKPLIDVRGKPMIQVVVENLNIDAHYIFIVQKEHYEKYNLKHLLSLISPNCDIIQTDGLTEGAACTTLLAEKLIDKDVPLLIANSDQFLEWNSNECLYSFGADNIDGGIITFKSTHPKWSFVKLDNFGFVEEVAEKKPISNLATAGIYYWKQGSDYVKYAKQMISKNIRTNNEFYVCPVFNEAIQEGKIFKIKNADAMWGIGTPEDLRTFLDIYKGEI
jgi:HAD superfamily hydrolase (TIGR01509 family)